MDNYKEAATQIVNLLTEALTASTPEVVTKFISSFLQEIQAYLAQLNDFMAFIANQVRQAESQYAGCDDVSDVTISYSVFKKLQYDEGQITTLLQEGVFLVDQLRHELTQEDIKYQVGMSYRGILYERQLDLEQILQYTRVEFNTRQHLDNIFKLRMYNKSNFREQMLRQKGVLETAEADSTTLWSHIKSFVSADHPSGNKYRNKGNAYEVYRILVTRNQSNHIPPASIPSDDELENLFAVVRSNTSSSVKGGDYGLEQMKYFSSAPSIISMSTIQKSLTEIATAFQQYLAAANGTALYDALHNLFIKDLNQLGGEVVEEGKKSGEEVLKETVERLDITMHMVI